MRNDIINKILDLIGDTPLYKLNINENNIYLKLEKYNLTGSIKDRAAKQIIIDYLENKKDLFNGIICVTSFNLGLSLAVLAKYYNINLILLMNNTKDYIKMKYLDRLNIKIINLPNKTYSDLNKIAEKLADRINFYYVDQFDNEFNQKANILLGSEINNDLNQTPNYIFCGVGSGGTLAGLKKYFDKNTIIIGVIPYLDEKVPGMNNEFIPNNITNIDYKVCYIKLDNAKRFQEKLIKEQGLLLGISSGAIYYSMLDYLKINNIRNKTIVCICPDGLDRYLDE